MKHSMRETNDFDVSIMSKQWSHLVNSNKTSLSTAVYWYNHVRNLDKKA